MQLQGDPPPYHDVERGDTQAEQSSARNLDEELKPGERARVVLSDPIVKVVPLCAGWKSSGIEVRRSALPKARFSDPDIIMISWDVVSLALLCSNYRYDPPTINAMVNEAFPKALFVFRYGASLHFSKKISLFRLGLLSIDVCSFIILQLILTVECYREAKEFFLGTLFVLIMMVLFGSFTVFVVFSYYKQASEVAMAAVAADESKPADGCSESHSMLSQFASDASVDPEQNTRPPQACDYSRQRTGIRDVWFVRNDPVINVVPFDGDWSSMHSIIVRRSVLPLKLRKAALLLQHFWIVVPTVVSAAGCLSTNYNDARNNGITAVCGTILLFQIIDARMSVRFTHPRYPVYFAAIAFLSANIQQVITVASYHGNRTYFVYNLGALVLLVLFGILSTIVVYQYHYQAGQAALDALAAERARRSLPKGGDSHECDSTSKETSRQ